MGKKYIQVEVLVSCAAFSLPKKIWFRTFAKDAEYVFPTGDIFALSLLPLALHLREDMIFEIPVSREVFEHLQSAVSLLASWKKTDIWPGFEPIALSATSLISAQRTRETGQRAAFFSLGLDSFFTLQEADKEKTTQLSHLIFGLGFDIQRHNTALLGSVLRNVHSVANTTGKQVLFIETNFNHDFSAKIMNWELVHGFVLAGVAQFFGKGLDQVFINTEDAVLSRAPYGIHPDLAPLWSSANMAVTLFGSEYSRGEKTQIIRDNPLAQRYLRVCWENRGNKYNCGICPKCVRTMFQLHTAHRLEKFTGFPSKIPLAAVQRMVEPKQRLFLWWKLLQQLSFSELTYSREILFLLARSYRRLLYKNIFKNFQAVRESSLIKPYKQNLKQLLRGSV